MFSNNLQRKIPDSEEISVNIFLVHKYAQKMFLILFVYLLLLKIEQLDSAQMRTNS